ncbi:MAG TPA: hypothetical protein PK711_10245 [Bacteroidales bacterium]|nr:hypothetical protein [Bacteroidales bacterium]
MEYNILQWFEDLLNDKFASFRNDYVTCADLNDKAEPWPPPEYHESTNSRTYYQESFPFGSAEKKEDNWVEFTINELDRSLRITKREIKEYIIDDELSPDVEKLDKLKALKIQSIILRKKSNELEVGDYLTELIVVTCKKNITYLKEFINDKYLDLLQRVPPRGKQYSYPLRNIHIAYKDVKKVWEKLNGDGYIISDDFDDFIEIFYRQDQPVQNKVIWNGLLGELKLFVTLLYEKSLIDPRVNSGQKWKIAANCFELTDGRVLDPIKFRGQKLPKNQKPITDIIEMLKTALGLEKSRRK